MSLKDLKVPSWGERIGWNGSEIEGPDKPIIPYIEGDGTGPDIWAASQRVFDAAVQKAYDGQRQVAWFEVFAGEAAKKQFDNWLPDDTVDAFKTFVVGIKGPLTTPIGGGIRSLLSFGTHTLPSFRRASDMSVGLGWWSSRAISL